MGGAFALLLGTLGPDGLRAVSDNYGRPPASDVDLTRTPPVIACFGADDRMLKGAGPELEHRLTAAGVENEVRTFPGAAHAFLTEDQPLFGLVRIPGTHFAPEAAAQAWPRVFAFLEEHTAAR
jgi:carboxymethylenebutenolidase